MQNVLRSGSQDGYLRQRHTDMCREAIPSCTCVPIAIVHACRGPCLAPAKIIPSRQVDADNIEHGMHAESKLEVQMVLQRGLASVALTVRY